MNYVKKLDYMCIQKVSLMALNDKFTIQELKLDKKDLSHYIKPKELEAHWNKECAKHPSNNHYKIFCD